MRELFGARKRLELYEAEAKDLKDAVSSANVRYHNACLALDAAINAEVRG